MFSLLLVLHIQSSHSFVDTSNFAFFGGCGMVMMIYSGMNINERYRDKSEEEAQIKLYSTSETPKAE